MLPGVDWLTKAAESGLAPDLKAKGKRVGISRLVGSRTLSRRPKIVPAFDSKSSGFACSNVSYFLVIPWLVAGWFGK